MFSGKITECTRDQLKEAVDTLCGLMSELNSMNYDLFIKKREELIENIDKMVQPTPSYMRTQFRVGREDCNC
jgi:hypothetical protein